MASGSQRVRTIYTDQSGNTRQAPVPGQTQMPRGYTPAIGRMTFDNGAMPPFSALLDMAGVPVVPPDPNARLAADPNWPFFADEQPPVMMGDSTIAGGPVRINIANPIRTPLAGSALMGDAWGGLAGVLAGLSPANMNGASVAEPTPAPGGTGTFTRVLSELSTRPPTSFQGSSTGRNYNVGQNYTSGGYIKQAQADGTFKTVGRDQNFRPKPRVDLQGRGASTVDRQQAQRSAHNARMYSGIGSSLTG